MFKKNKWSRLKMPSHDASFRRLIHEFLNLPDTWQQALLENTLHTDTTFEHERDLISKTLNRMIIKAEGSNEDLLALVKEIDIICNSPEEAKPVIELIRLLGWQIQCHFMSPKIGNLSWLDWKTELELEDFEFNEESVVKTTINNSHGRMTIRLKRASISSKNRQIKHFEQYLLLSLLGLAIHI